MNVLSCLRQRISQPLTERAKWADERGLRVSRLIWSVQACLLSSLLRLGGHVIADDVCLLLYPLSYGHSANLERDDPERQTYKVGI